MSKKEPSMNEAEVAKTLQDLLSKIGFNVIFSDANKQLRNPDFIAKKRVDGNDYKIAIEIKENSNLNEAVKYGIETLKKVNEVETFDKLLLLLTNRNTNNLKSPQLDRFHLENPTKLEIIDLTELEKWSENLKNELIAEEQNEVFYYIRLLSKKFIELVAKNPSYLMNLEWIDLERTVAELFEGIGFKVTLTPSSKDGGKDVILECVIDKIKKTYIIEIKHWRSRQKVGKEAIKEFTKIIINEKRERGLFLATYGFSNNYFESLTEKEKKIISFGEQEKIIELCKIYERINNGIWNPINTLEDILFENTITLKN